MFNTSDLTSQQRRILREKEKISTSEIKEIASFYKSFKKNDKRKIHRTKK